MFKFQHANLSVLFVQKVDAFTINTTSIRTLPEDKWIIAENAHEAIVTKADYFDRSFNWLDFRWGYEHSRIKPEKP